MGVSYVKNDVHCGMFPVPADAIAVNELERNSVRWEFCEERYM